QLSYLFSSMFIFWVIAGGVFQFNLSWQPDTARVLMLPVRVPRAYLAKVLLGLLGPWLIVILPPIVWISYRQAGRPIDFIAAIIGVVLFAILANQLTSIASYFKVQSSGRALYLLGLFAAFFAVNLFVMATIRAKSMGDPSLLNKLVHPLKSAANISLWHWLPGAILARIQLAALHHSLSSIVFYDGVLCLLVIAAGFVEIRTIRVAFQERRLQFGRVGRKLLCCLFTFAGNSPVRALMIKEFAALTEMRSVRLLLLFLSTYLPIFVVVVPPPNVFFLEAMYTLPVMIFSVVKGNLLGADY